MHIKQTTVALVGVVVSIATVAIAQSPLPVFLFGSEHTFFAEFGELPVAAAFDPHHHTLYIVLWKEGEQRIRIKELIQDTATVPAPPAPPTAPCTPAFPSPVPGWVPTPDCQGWVPPI